MKYIIISLLIFTISCRYAGDNQPDSAKIVVYYSNGTMENMYVINDHTCSTWLTLNNSGCLMLNSLPIRCSVIKYFSARDDSIVNRLPVIYH